MKLHNGSLPMLLFVRLGDSSETWDTFIPRHTATYKELFDSISSSTVENDVCELNFSPDMLSLFQQKIVIGQTRSLDQITSAQLFFCDANGNTLLDDSGSPLFYKSIPQDLGHGLDLLHQTTSFSYVKCRLALQPKCDFDPQTLFFHFSKPSPKSEPA